MAKTPPKDSIADRTRSYIDAHPSVKDCMAKDLINYSSLARQIMRELSIKNEEAVTVACRRYASKLRSHDHESEILRILGRSRLEMKTKICAVTAKNDWMVLHMLDAVFMKFLNEKSIMQVIQSGDSMTIIMDEKLKDAVVENLGRGNIINVRDDLVEIAVKSPEGIAETSGVFSFLSSNLAGGGVNIVEAVSVHTDTIYVVREDDMMRAYSILSKMIDAAEEMMT